MVHKPSLPPVYLALFICCELICAGYKESDASLQAACSVTAQRPASPRQPLVICTVRWILLCPDRRGQGHSCCVPVTPCVHHPHYSFFSFTFHGDPGRRQVPPSHPFDGRGKRGSEQGSSHWPRRPLHRARARPRPFCPPYPVLQASLPSLFSYVPSPSPFSALD